MSKLIYADNAATTALSPRALAAMMPYLTEEYGNPSSIYRHGGRAKKALEAARDAVAGALGAFPDEILFTSGGTESDNWAIRGAAALKSRPGGHILSTGVEHHAVAHTLEYLESQGFAVTYLPVDEAGRISLEAVEAALRPDTVLITIMMANNEIGTLYPIAEISALAKAKGILFHTDAVQAVGHLPVDVKALGVDMLSLSAHKFHGPKGVGALYIRRGLRIPALLYGGGQERGRRPGTENVASIVGMAAALTEAVETMAGEAKRLTALQNRLIAGVLSAVPYSFLTGHPTERLPGHASFVFSFVEGESILLRLDQQGICASSGSACSSASLDPSHVLLAIGLPHERAHGSVRFTLGTESTEADIDAILNALPPIIEGLRSMSPLWEDQLKQNK